MEKLIYGGVDIIQRSNIDKCLIVDDDSSWNISKVNTSKDNWIDYYLELDNEERVS